MRLLEDWVIDTLAQFGVHGEIRPGRVGVWVPRTGQNSGEDKIAAIGIRLRRWVSYHGISINVTPKLSHYDGIVPCGIAADGPEPLGVTSLQALGCNATMDDVDQALLQSFKKLIGPTAAFSIPPS